MQSPLRPERAHDYSSAKYPQLDNPQLGLVLKRLMARLGKLMLRENRDFHVILKIEAALREYSFLGQGICILASTTLQKLLYK
nr:hypothetical protein [Nostoc sp. ChiSLP03a]